LQPSGEIDLVIAEVNALEQHGRSAAPARQHSIVLCCAQSVHTMVEEVARSLAGLGFTSRVVCGAEARAALLGRGRDPVTRDEPTIYVVCVQGALKEQVLQPLRQALATHGGPNEHLFVAVLDLALPLGMVGQIRRFAEALERMPGRRRRDPVADRRQWREHFGRRELEGVRTRAHIPLHVVERAATRPGVGATLASDPVTGPRRIVSARKPAKIAPTKKYRAVTGAFGTLPELPPALPKRRHARTHHRRRAVVPPAAARAEGAAGAIDTKTRPAGGKIKRTAKPAAPSKSPLSSPRADEQRGTTKVARDFGGAITASNSTGRRLGIAGVVVAAAAAVWFTGLGPDLLARFGSDRDGTVSTTRPDVESAEASAVATRSEVAPARAVGSDAAHLEEHDVAKTDRDEAGGSPTLDESPPALDDEPSGEALAATNETPPVDDEAQAITRDDAGEAPGHVVLERWVAENRLRKVRNLYVSSRQGEQTTWNGARQRCRQLQIAGVEGWRLAHRRELKLLDVAGYLATGLTYWSYTKVDDDPAAAYALDTKTRSLVQYLKQEPTGDVICVLSHD
jgi:hypothetical protein